MKLHRQWRRIVRHAWSVRFWLAAALCVGLEHALPLLAGNGFWSAGVFAALAELFGIAGLIARFLAQKEFEDDEAQT
ncbi:MAG: hypothetical protein KKB37_11425 [Alphaproteobacteria bacterium]|nr:hypothetical protein [Alphaproteobacteria bacterium]